MGRAMPTFTICRRQGKAILPSSNIRSTGADVTSVEMLCCSNACVSLRTLRWQPASTITVPPATRGAMSSYSQAARMGLDFARTTLLASSSQSDTKERAPWSTMSWSRTTALGFPVVPAVKKTAAPPMRTCSGLPLAFRAGGARTFRVPTKAPSASSGHDGTARRPRLPESVPVSASRAPTSATSSCKVEGDMATSRGSQAAPACMTPRAATTSCCEGAKSSTTTCPLPMPASLSANANLAIKVSSRR
mmetsp:Transcript_149264/g.416035  ORF Transcript_149264/g.416035 Transcript_149264/m.416035 type:complete len:248 (-) Transcript_149264:27-770(-)